ncbi:hypothetical protein RchiOBHm_Chr5g0050431 [Rosa chinensis]|uniref:Uncharacterized protein n=1 Tax=Rosa chinensis TaxID=74649 RepID=A0A2P6QF50_ROSCH|nr:hypothetical protein RchiOBHm_Chr5g0050431 [Rosa chinensis]
MSDSHSKPSSIQLQMFPICSICFAVRGNLRGAKMDFGKTKDDLKSLQSIGQIIGEFLRPLDYEHCK